MKKKLVAENIIYKIIENIITKHGAFFQSIRNKLYILTGTTDEDKSNISKEEFEKRHKEYARLRDDIWNFMQDVGKTNTEHLWIRGMDNEEFKNEGDESGVGFTPEMKRYAEKYPLLHTIHNHPDESSGLIGGGDIISLGEYGEKYSIVYGDNGLSIVKSPYDGTERSGDMDLQEKFEKVGARQDIARMQRVYQDYPNIADDVINAINDGSIFDDSKKYLLNIFHRVEKNHVDDLRDTLEFNFNDVGLDCEVYFIPKHQKNNKSE